ncbi:MAG: hypothetical protein GY754_06465 [bacterium]|nr:hypothetical protein [bacterium]
MVKGVRILFFISTILVLVLFKVFAGPVDPADPFDEDTLKIMPFVTSKSSCYQCHKKSEREKLKDPTRTCKNMCETCHKKDIENHHPIGDRVKSSIQAKIRKRIPLNSRKRVTCYSCHNLHINRYAATPWKAESLFDSVFKSKDRYKTYYLTVRNNEGQLCKKCH